MKNIINFLKRGHDRTIRIKKNIILSFLYKGISILVNILLVPLVLHYLGKEQYGIWLTFSSLIMWFSFFDVGLGNGLRNKLAESLTKKDIELSRKYISTTYALVTIIFVFIMVVFWFINPYLNWSRILNSNALDNKEYVHITYWIFIPFFFKFIFMLIGNILYADQKPSINNLFNPITNVIIIASMVILTRTTNNSLLYVSIVLSISQLLVPFFFNFILFRGIYKKIRPSLFFVDFSLIKSLFSIGTKFFIIQLSLILLFSATNIFIAHFESQTIVAEYNIAQKYFFTLVMFFSIIQSPFWSAITEAYVEKDIEWIKRSLKKLNKISLYFVIIAVLMLLTAKLIFRLWLGNEYQINYNIIILTFLLAISQIIKFPYNNIINGTGKIHLHFLHSSAILIFFIPVTIIMAKFRGLGVNGILFTILIFNISGLILWIKQANLIITQKAKGIWLK